MQFILSLLLLAVPENAIFKDIADVTDEFEIVERPLKTGKERDREKTIKDITRWVTRLETAYETADDPTVSQPLEDLLDRIVDFSYSKIHLGSLKTRESEREAIFKLVAAEQRNLNPGFSAPLENGIWIQLPGEIEIRFYPWKYEFMNLGKLKTGNLKIFEQKEKAATAKSALSGSFDLIATIPLSELKNSSHWKVFELLRLAADPGMPFSPSGRCREILGKSAKIAN